MTDLKQRLAAILAADAAGYSRLMALDEQATVRALDVARAAFHLEVARHRGRVVDTAGDSVLAVFETASGALNAALAIQSDLSAGAAGMDPAQVLRFRIGLHLGDVIEKDDGTIYGDGVNIAARVQSLAEPGGIAVSDAIHGAVRGRVPARFVDRGEHAAKNIALPIRLFEVLAEPTVGAGVDAGDAASASAPRLNRGAADQGKTAIAVLPFRVQSDDRATGFLADGLVEDVIALLARMPGFTLIAHASSSAFREHRASVAEVARSLGVRYVVEGSVRPVGPGVRITPRLVDGESGQLLWSGRFEAALEQAVDLQDDIVRGIVAELEPELTRARIDSIRRQRPGNLDAWSLYHDGVGAIALKGWTEDAMTLARERFQAAFELDAGFALARAHHALMSALGVNCHLLARTDTLIQNVRIQAERAIADDDGSSEVLGLAGCALTDIGERARGMEFLQRAVILDPSNAQAHVAMGASLALSGDRPAGIARMRHGMHISPRDRRLGFWGWAMGNFILREGDPELALKEARASIGRDPRLFLARVLEATSLLALNRDEEARQALQGARAIRPRLRLLEIADSHGRRAADALGRIWGPSPPSATQP